MNFLFSTTYMLKLHQMEFGPYLNFLSDKKLQLLQRLSYKLKNELVFDSIAHQLCIVL